MRLSSKPRLKSRGDSQGTSPDPDLTGATTRHDCHLGKKASLIQYPWIALMTLNEFLNKNSV